MANLFTSGYSSFLILRRDLEDVLDEMELPWRMRREMDRLFAESTSPIVLWRNMEHLLEDFGAPFVLRRRIENVFARVVGRGVEAFGMNTPTMGGQFGQQFGQGFGPFAQQGGAYYGNPWSTYGSQFANPQLAQYGSQWNTPYFTQGYGSQFGQSPWSSQYGASFAQGPWSSQGYGSQGYGSPFANTSPYFAGRDYVGQRGGEWLGSRAFGAGEWLNNSSRSSDGFVPVRNWTRGNVFGSPSNTYGGIGNGAYGLGSMWAGNTWQGGALGNTTAWGNSIGQGAWGNHAYGPWNSTYGQLGANGVGNIYGQYSHLGANGAGNTYGQYGQLGALNHGFGSGALGYQYGGGMFGQQPFGQIQDFVPPVELIERDGEFVVRVELAGVREQDVEIRANEQVLTIRGERRERFDNEVARHVGAYEYSERRYGAFQRTVTLPQGIDAAHIHAVFRDGVLELRIPQAETFRQRRIPIGRIDEQPRVINDGQVHPRPHVS